MALTTVVLLAVIQAYPALDQVPDSLRLWIPDSIQHPTHSSGMNAYSILHFPAKTTFATGFVEARFVGLLPVPGRAPYLVMAGRSCDACDARVTLYIHSPADGPMKGGERDPRYPYPGKKRDYDDNPVFESRAFFGQCLGAAAQEVVWFAKRLQADGTWKETVFALVAGQHALEEREYGEPTPSLKATLERVRAERCWEVPSLDQYREP